MFLICSRCRELRSSLAASAKPLTREEFNGVECLDQLADPCRNLTAPARITTEALKRIAEFFEIEAEIRGRSADQRQAVRQEKTRPLVEALKNWLEKPLVQGQAPLPWWLLPHDTPFFHHRDEPDQLSVMYRDRRLAPDGVHVRPAPTPASRGRHYFGRLL